MRKPTPTPARVFLRRLSSPLPRGLMRRLPRPIRTALIAARLDGRAKTSHTKRTNIDQRLSIDTYWLNSTDGNDEGPAASVFWDDDELMRIDILKRRPHVHYRLYDSLGAAGRPSAALSPAPEQDPLAQLRWQLSHNIAYALHLDRRRTVQRHRPDQAALDAAVDKAVTHLATLLEQRHAQDTQHDG